MTRRCDVDQAPRGPLARRTHLTDPQSGARGPSIAREMCLCGVRHVTEREVGALAKRADRLGGVRVFTLRGTAGRSLDQGASRAGCHRRRFRLHTGGRGQPPSLSRRSVALVARGVWRRDGTAGAAAIVHSIARRFRFESRASSNASASESRKVPGCRAIHCSPARREAKK